MANKSIGRARIQQELRNFKKQPLDYLYAEPLQSDLYTWHFTFRGPQNTDFHEGLYHGQILLPFQYPFKPPDIVFNNTNGRFEVNTKICLTITQYHTEEWNSAWTIRTMLEAVISLFNERVMGHGYLEKPSQVRRHFALASHHYTCEKCGKISEIIKPRDILSNSKKQQQLIKQQKIVENGQKLVYRELQKQKIEEKPSPSIKNQKQQKINIQQHKVPRSQHSYITQQELFIQTLKKGNDEYLSIINSKKLFTE